MKGRCEGGERAVKKGGGRTVERGTGQPPQPDQVRLAEVRPVRVVQELVLRTPAQ